MLQPLYRIAAVLLVAAAILSIPHCGVADPPEMVIPELTTFTATAQEQVPEWAEIERRLIDETTAVAVRFS